MRGWDGSCLREPRSSSLGPSHPSLSGWGVAASVTALACMGAWHRRSRWARSGEGLDGDARDASKDSAAGGCSG